jgi:hypothetical protein
MRASAHVFAMDLIDEGFGRVLDTARDRGGLDGMVLAATYHQAFDIFPHNPLRRVYRHEGGAAYFRPDLRRFEGLRIQPIVSRLAAEVDPLGRLVDEAGRRGMTVRAWTNHMQETDQGPLHPEAVVRNAFGDPYERWLCPSNPDVRAYVAAMSAEIARYGVESLVLESMCYQPWDIIFSAGRTHYPYGPVARFLLGLCFCEHCTVAAQAAGVAIGDVQAFVVAELPRVLAGEPSLLDDIPLEPEPVRALVDGQMGAFLDVRRRVVTSFIAETADAIRRASSSRVVAFEWSGGLVGFAGGAASGRVSHFRAWQDGFDLGEVATVCDGLAILAYTRELDQFRTDVAGYRAVIPADRSLSVAMRAMTPDCHSLEELRAKVAIVRDHDIDWIEFYHYGLMRLAHLDWIGAAVRESETVPVSTASERMER